MRFDYRSKSFDIEGTSQSDHIYREMSRTGTFYEIDLLEYIHRIKPSIYSRGCKNVVIDIGANIGNHSLFLCAFVADHLIAIEPNPSVLFQLQLNLSKNVDNYTLLECAVGDKEGTGTIIMPGSTSDNVGAARVDVDSEGDVEISTVDLIVSSWKDKVDSPVSVALMKVDVEGMESQVLKGAEETILSYRPHIFAEAQTKEELLEIHNYLRTFGYKRMPGRWAATPVYHFVCSPTPVLIATALYCQFRRAARRLSRLTRRLTER